MMIKLRSQSGVVILHLNACVSFHSLPPPTTPRSVSFSFHQKHTVFAPVSSFTTRTCFFLRIDNLTPVKSDVHTRLGLEHTLANSQSSCVWHSCTHRRTCVGACAQAPRVFRAILESKQTSFCRPNSLCIDKHAAHPAFTLNMMAAS